jgi:hypothetical protein
VDNQGGCPDRGAGPKTATVGNFYSGQVPLPLSRLEGDAAARLQGLKAGQAHTTAESREPCPSPDTACKAAYCAEKARPCGLAAESVNLNEARTPTTRAYVIHDLTSICAPSAVGECGPCHWSVGLS